MGKVKSWVMDMEEQIWSEVESGAESVEQIAANTGISDLSFIRETVREMYEYGDVGPHDVIIDCSPPPAVYGTRIGIDDEIPF